MEGTEEQKTSGNGRNRRRVETEGKVGIVEVWKCRNCGTVGTRAVETGRIGTEEE